MRHVQKEVIGLPSKYGRFGREGSPVFSNVESSIQDRVMNLYIFFENPCKHVLVREELYAFRMDVDKAVNDQTLLV
jgi:hypothetical protein